MSSISRIVLGVGLLAIAGCSVSQQDVQAVATLADAAAAQSKTVADVVDRGALFCRRAEPVLAIGEPLLVALVDAATGLPVSVLDQAANDVASACSAIGAEPVPGPSDPGVAGTVPTVKARTVLPPVS